MFVEIDTPMHDDHDGLKLLKKDLLLHEVVELALHDLDVALEGGKVAVVVGVKPRVKQVTCSQSMCRHAFGTCHTGTSDPTLASDVTCMITGTVISRRSILERNSHFNILIHLRHGACLIRSYWHTIKQADTDRTFFHSASKFAYIRVSLAETQIVVGCAMSPAIKP